MKDKKVIRRTRYETPEGKVTEVVIYDDFSTEEIKPEVKKPEPK